MIDLSLLEAKVLALAELIKNIKSDYAAMLAMIAELKALVDGKGELQDKVDALAAMLSGSLAELEAVDNSFPLAPEPEPDPVEPPIEPETTA